MHTFHSSGKLQNSQATRTGCLWKSVLGVSILISFKNREYNYHYVAIKECTPNNTTPRKQILVELDALSRLNNDSIIRNFGYNIHQDPDDPSKEIISFIMEKADGDLEGVIGKLENKGIPRTDRNKVPLKRRKLYILQIAIGLMYLYKMGVYHADLKIDNVLMVKGNCKIADFGLAKMVENRVLCIGILINRSRSYRESHWIFWEHNAVVVISMIHI